MPFELIIRLSEIKLYLILAGLIVFMVTGVGIVTETIENKKWQTIGIALSIILGTFGILVPTTDQYLATCLYNEKPPKTAEQTLEIIKKARMDYHHLRAEQYKKD